MRICSGFHAKDADVSRKGAEGNAKGAKGLVNFTINELYHSIILMSA
jgi:hypothetical protein